MGRFVPALLALPLLGKRQALETVQNLSTTAADSPSGARISVTPPTLSVPRRG